MRTGTEAAAGLAPLILLSLASGVTGAPAAEVSPTGGTAGTLVEITGGDFGKRRGRVVLFTEHHGRTRRYRLRVRKGGWSPDAISCEIPRRIRGTAGEQPVLSVRPRARWRSNVDIEDAFTLAGPEIDDAPATGLAGDALSVTGRWFGTRKGRAFFVWPDGARSRRKRLKVESWSMDPATGASAAVVRLPEGLPPETTGRLVVESRIGAGEVPFHHGAHPETTPPLAKIRFPPTGSLTDADRINVTGTAADATAVDQVTVNGVPATTTDGWATWRAEVPLVHGTNRLVAAARDRWGNTDPAAAETTVENVGRVLAEAGPITSDVEGNRALVVDGDALVAVDLATVDRTVLASDSRGSGWGIWGATAVTWDPTCGRALVVYGLSASLLSIDPVSGDRTLRCSDYCCPGGVAYDAWNDRALVTDNSSIKALDLATGLNRVVSGYDLLHPGETVGDGPSFRGLWGLGLTTGGSVAYAVDCGAGALLRVDLTTGDRTVVSGGTIGTGPFFSDPRDLSLDADERFAYICDDGLDALVRVDLATGNREIALEDLGGSGSFGFAGSTAVFSRRDALLLVDLESGERRTIAKSKVGNGPRMDGPDALGFRSEDGLGLVADRERNAVLEVQIATGHRTQLWASDGQEAVVFGFPQILSLDAASRRAWAFDFVSDALYEVDLVSGRIEVVTSPEVANGPTVTGPWAVAPDSVHGGSLVVGDSTSLLRVDPDTGDRVEISGYSRGEGPGFGYLQGTLAVEPKSSRAYLADVWYDFSPLGRLVAVDLETGDRTVAAEGWSVLPYSWELRIVLETERDRALITDCGGQSVRLASLSTGEISLLSSSGSDRRGSGPRIWPRGVAIDTLADIAYVADSNVHALFAVDLDTGDRVIISR